VGGRGRGAGGGGGSPALYSHLHPKIPETVPHPHQQIRCFLPSTEQLLQFPDICKPTSMGPPPLPSVAKAHHEAGPS